MYICTRTLRKVPVRLYTSWRLDILEWNVMITYGREWQDFLTCCSSRSRSGRTASTFGSLQHLPQISLSLLPSWYRSLVGSSTSCYYCYLARSLVRTRVLSSSWVAVPRLPLFVRSAPWPCPTVRRTSMRSLARPFKTIQWQLEAHVGSKSIRSICSIRRLRAHA